MQMPTDDNPVVVWEGDCFPLMQAMPDASVDAVVTDPPYAEKTHAGARTGRGDRSLIDFDSFDDATFLKFAEECVRLAKRWVVMTCDWRHAAAALCGGRVPVIRTGVWVKPDAAPQFTGDRPGTGWEAVLMLHRPGRKRWNGGGHHAVWTCPVERNNEHRTQKPLRLVREWLRLFTDPNDTILDPFAGSGTTGVAAALEGRKCILIEKDPHYAAVARRRVAEVLGQNGLFRDVHCKAKTDLFTEAACYSP